MATSASPKTAATHTSGAASSGTSSTTGGAANPTAQPPANPLSSPPAAGAPYIGSQADKSNHGGSYGGGNSGRGAGHNNAPKQYDIPNGERQCYFGEVANERGTYWAQFLVRVNDKVSVMVDAQEPCLLSCTLLGGNAKLFINRPIIRAETHRSIAGEDTIVLFTKDGSGAASHLVMQYNRV